MTTTPSSNGTKRKKKRRLKKKVRIGLIIIGTCLGLCLIWPLAAMMNTMIEPLQIPVLAVLNVPSAAGSSKTKESAEDTSTADASSDDSVEEPVDPTKPYTRSDGLTVYPEDDEVQAVILLDAGHGNLDPGNVATDPLTGEQYYEKDINLKLTQMVQQDLEETNPNIKVYTTRDSDEFDFQGSEADLTRRVNLQNDLKETEGLDYFISIHCNAMPTTDENTSGYSFYIKPNDTASETMAEAISAEFEQRDWSSEQGIIQTVGNNTLQVISFSPTHAMLIEAGYMTNSSDLAGLLKTKTLKEIAAGIAAGISDTIMEYPEASKTDCPEQVIPGVTNPSKPAASSAASTS